MTVNIEGLGKITASKEVLNELTRAFSHQALYLASKGFHEGSLLSDTRSNAIFKVLYEAGYYGDKE